MEVGIDYDRVARWYDTYVTTGLDVPFWVEWARTHPGRRLEAMCGTGRLSLPILRAGFALSCVDRSAALLGVLRDKLAAVGLAADVFERDVRDLGLAGFDHAFVGFHSFSELVEDDDRRAALRSFRAALRPGGTLTLSLHAPHARAPGLDGAWRELGPFPRPDGGRLEVRGRYRLDPATGEVLGEQRYRELDRAGATVAEATVPFRFSLPEPASVVALAGAEGFTPLRAVGDYTCRPYDPASSPFWIGELGRP
jgi:SAM-dependent methyltransferase